MAVTMLELNRKCVPPRLDENDITTVVSIYPQDIFCYNPTVALGNEYTIKGGTFEEPGITLIKPTYWVNGNDPDRPPIPVIIYSVQYAESLVNDNINAMQEANGDVRPGVFLLPREQTLETVKGKFKHLLDDAKAKQKLWFENLIAKADVDWSRSNGNPLAVSKHARYAADMLGMKDKPWMGDIQAFKKIACPACTTMVSPVAVICSNCGYVLDEARASKMKFSKG